MSDIFFRESLPFKYMTQVPSAICAEDLDSPSVCITLSPDRARYFIIETRPSARRRKLIVRYVEKCIAALAVICTLLIKIVERSGERSLGTLVDDNPLFFGRELVKYGVLHSGLSLT